MSWEVAALAGALVAPALLLLGFLAVAGFVVAGLAEANEA